MTNQLVSYGNRAPSFVGPASVLGPQVLPSNILRYRGEGNSVVLNHFVLRQSKMLQRRGWDADVCSAPVRAAGSLHQLCVTRFGVSMDLTTFSTVRIVEFHCGFTQSGEKVFGSDNYHNSSRHDFVELFDGRIVRVVALIRLDLMGQGIDRVLVESTKMEQNERLSFLGAPILSETDEWHWVELKDIRKRLVALPHAFDKAWYFIIRDKHEARAWE